MTGPPRAVCFDLDDTLYDYAQYARSGLLAAADRLAERTGERHHGEVLELYFGEARTEGTFDVVLERHDYDPALVDELVEAYHGATGPLDPRPGVAAVLCRLGDRYRLGLVTDGRNGHAKLDRLGLADRFDAVVVTPTMDRSKAERAPFDRVLAALSTPPDRAAYVGDDPRVDFRVPNELGMATVRLRQGRYAEFDPSDEPAAPDREVDAIWDLLSLFDNSWPRTDPIGRV